MGNRNYCNGRAREYRIIEKFKSLGYITLRASGSHGFADVIAIHPEKKIIYFIQAKPRSASNSFKKGLTLAQSWLQGVFTTSFQTISLFSELNFIGGKK